MPGLNVTRIAHQTSQHNIKCESTDLIFYYHITDKMVAAAVDKFIYECIGGHVHFLKSTLKLICQQSELSGNGSFG